MRCKYVLWPLGKMNECQSREETSFVVDEASNILRESIESKADQWNSNADWQTYRAGKSFKCLGLWLRPCLATRETWDQFLVLPWISLVTLESHFISLTSLRLQWGQDFILCPSSLSVKWR
uniref:Uncharacterized protein n=1 Tax=Chelydra serpentina TaxID=8475 RepID=A0A8C3RWV8_CHESE